MISRKSAIASGLKRYYTGKPCANGHLSERMVGNRGCVECNQSALKLYRLENKEKAKAQSKVGNAKRRLENPEKIKRYAAEWYANNRCKVRASRAPYEEMNAQATRDRANRYRAANPGSARDYRMQNAAQILARNSKRRAGRIHATPKWSAELTDFVAHEAASLASLRSILTGFKWHVDHMIPLKSKTACGLHTWSNLQVIPARLNIAKNNRMIFTKHGEWIMAS